MIVYSASILLTAASCIALGTFVYAKRPGSRVNRIFALLSAAVGLWSLSLFLHSLAHTPASALLWSRVAHLWAAFIPTLYLHFILVLTGRREESRLLVFAYVCSAVFFVAALTPPFIPRVERISQFELFPQAGPLYPVFLAFYLFVVSQGVLLLVRAHQELTGRRKAQTRYVLVGSAIGFLGGSTNFLPMFGVNVVPYGNYFMFLYCAVLGYAILKYQLMDVTLVLKKSLTLTALAVLILVPAFGVVILAQRIFFGEVHLGFSLVMSLLFLVIGLLFPTLKLKTEQTIEQTLFRRRYAYLANLRDLSRSMVTILDLPTLLGKIVETVSRTMQSQRVVLALIGSPTPGVVYEADQGLRPLPPQPEGWERRFSERDRVLLREALAAAGTARERALAAWLAGFEAQVAIVLTVKDRLAGVLALAPRLDGTPYSSEDLEVLGTFADQAAVAIENAELFSNLTRAHAELKELDRLKGEFVQNISHELITPISPIVGYLDMLASQEVGPLTAEQLECLAAMRKSTERLRALIEDLLEMTRLEVGKYVPKWERVSTEELVSSSVDEVAPLAREKGIAITTTVPLGVPDLRGERAKLMQVLTNLLRNATKFTPRGGRIAVAVRTVPPPAGPPGAAAAALGAGPGGA
ncbi:MAG TPA: histidine kinase N-terminal 7TM domain-containing protein, partial [Thermodesulfobacteriota bacterium]|nr:histidine kinase N-terminal 7TM domain-containing protein [Thermodesulfobacteriota bacterium]